MNQITKDLSNQKWFFRQQHTENWFPAEVPGCVHNDLYQNHIINDPFFGEEELNLQWIDKVDWEYRTTFDVNHDLFSQEAIELVCHGMDTYASIYINDKKVLDTYNMFRIWQADIKKYIKLGENKLFIYFHSPIQKHIKDPDSLGYNLPASNDNSEVGGIKDKKLSVFTRKAPYHYGWDWGPRFVTSGIWKDIYISGWSGLRINDIYIEQSDVSEKKADLNALVEIESQLDREVNVELFSDKKMVTSNTHKLTKGINHIIISYTIENPRLWWTRQLGEPYLYEFVLCIDDGHEFSDQKSIRTGIREIRLVRENITKGKTFHFELNGVPVFIKGANHIPNDSFLTQITDERYRHEIASAIESNINMLRVWGGGIYESDKFYQLCDEYGVLVWQDFMFACSMYPGDEAFINNVKEEAIDNVKRLRNHACIALWCGNNEIDEAWSEYDENKGWGWRKRYNTEQKKIIWNAYEKIFHQLLPDIINEYNPSIDYWPSSPMQELSYTSTENGEMESNNSGDMHYWDVWHKSQPIEEYKKNVGQFMSEYGFQSFPEMKTIESFADNKDLSLESNVMLHHQKNSSGNRLIKEYMQANYKEPKDFESFIYLSQILQADAIQIAIEAHRLNKPYCMGTLYWQLNDCWPVASWSSMDYYGRWKYLQYIVKKRYKDTILIVDQQNGYYNFHIVTDKLQAVSATHVIELIDGEGHIIYREDSTVEASPNDSTLIDSKNCKAIFEKISPNQIVIMRSHLIKEGTMIDSVDTYITPKKDITLEKPGIRYEFAEENDKSYILISTNKFAQDVWLETDKEGYFSDNKFNLFPGEVKKVHFYKRTFDINEKPFINIKIDELKITSMYDLINS